MNTAIKTPYKLYHFPLCPFSRKVRIFLGEKNFNADLVNKNFWEKSKDLLIINPKGEVPILELYESQQRIIGSNVICEYLEEKSAANRLLGNSPETRAEVRRINNWFDWKFFPEVSKYIISEKLIKYYKNQGHVNPEAIRVAKINISYHLRYIEYLLKERKWLAGNKLTLADLTTAAHLSSLDYLGDVEWEKYNIVKEWYMLVKSRPSLANILNDYISGFPPSRNYADLDF